jgi:hypothetical protein
MKNGGLLERMTFWGGKYDNKKTPLNARSFLLFSNQFLLLDNIFC